MVVSDSNQLRFPIARVPSAILGVDLDVECPFLYGGKVHISSRVVAGVYDSWARPKMVHYLCLSCWSYYTMQVRSGISVPVIVLPKAERKPAQDTESKEVRSRLIRHVMDKRMKNKQCALCTESFVRKVGGLKFCEAHAAAAEERGL